MTPVLTAAPPVPDRLVPLLWAGRTVVCLASGPSLTAADVDLVCGRAPVIAVNDAIRLAPWADVFYSGAGDWWTPQRQATVLAGFRGLRVRLCLNQMRPGVTPGGVIQLANTGDDGLELQPWGLRNYRNSGGAAINLAVHFGARRILLLGYDMRPTDGRHHFCDQDRRRSHGSPYPAFCAYMATMVAPLAAAGVTVVNCTRTTRLVCFPQADLAAALDAAP